MIKDRVTLTASSSELVISATSGMSTRRRIATARSRSARIGDWNASQARSRAASTASLSAASQPSSCDSLAIPDSMTQSRMRATQSYSASKRRRSFDLYRSWLPLVEWPCGCVISVTWISAGLCSRRTLSIAVA